jgi:hypothetical protein
MQLDINEIKSIIPHRYPFLLIDKVLDFESGKFAIAQKMVSSNEEFFKGHFPNYPVMPGVLILEGMAQTGAVAILSLEENKGKIALFAGADKVRFKRQVKPGDVITFECELLEQKGVFGIGKAKASVNDKVVCQAELKFVIN